MTIVDVHAHLDLKDFDNKVDLVFENARKAGVSVIINNGLNPASNRRTLELSKKYPIVKSALGIYPGELIKTTEKEVDREIEFIRKQKIIAIGEVGLDFYHKPFDAEKQKNVFRKFIQLAKDMSIPIIVHSRNSEKECIDILEEEGAKKVVLHCFNGNNELIKRAESLGYHFSIPCIITFAKQFQDLVKEVNINYLLTETDAPYMSPFRGKQNEPANIKVTIKEIAKIKGFQEKETEDTLYLNYQRLFQ